MNSYRRNGERIRQLEEEIAAIEETIGAKAIVYDSQPHGTDVGKPTEAMAMKLLERKEQLEAMKYQLWKSRIRIEKVICMIDKTDYAEVLQRRYIRKQKFPEIATEMHLSESGVLKIHGKALAYISKLGSNG